MEAVGAPQAGGQAGGQAAWHAQVLGRTRLSPSAFEIELERPPGFRFEAGQSVRVLIRGQGRDYSLAGSPSASTLLLVVRRIEDGAVSPELADSPPGCVLDFTGPHGLFTLRAPARPLVLAATGVGIAPFLSMVRAGVLSGTGFTMLQGARSAGELFYGRELEAAAGLYVPCVSREASAGSFRGRLTEWARGHMADLMAAGSLDLYLCGSRGMVRDMILLVDERAPGCRVYTEIFF